MSLCVYYDVLVNYYKFFIPKLFKWGLRGVCTIIFPKDIYKNLWKYSFMDSSQKIFFLKNCTNLDMEIFPFYGIRVEPIWLRACWASQNDCLKLIFVKNFYVHSWQKRARKGRKMTTHQSQIFMRFFLQNCRNLKMKIFAFIS